MSVLHALLPVQHALPCESAPRWLHECQAVWMTKLRRRQTRNVSRKGVGFKTRERISSEVAGSSKMTSSTLLQLRCACVVELPQLFFSSPLSSLLCQRFFILLFHTISSSSPLLGLSRMNRNSSNRLHPSLIAPNHDLEV